MRHGRRPGRLFRPPPRTDALTGKDVDAELDAFLEARVAHLVAARMTPVEARTVSLRGIRQHACREEARIASVECIVTIRPDAAFASGGVSLRRKNGIV